MRRRVALLCGFLTFPLVAAGCTAETGAKEDILIGVPIEQTGTAAQLGLAELNALRLVADDINRNGGVLGRKIRLVVRDNRSDPAESKKQVTDLIDNENVTGIVGAGLTATTLSFADLVEEKKVPTVSMGAADTLVAKRKFIFKTPPNGAAIVDVLADELVRKNTKTVAFLAANNQFGNQGVQVVTAGARQASITIKRVERFADGDKDLSQEVSRLVETEPQAILVSAIMPAAAFAAKAIKNSGYTGDVYFDGGAGADLFVGGSVASDTDGMFMVHSSILAANQLTATTPSALAQKEFFVKYTQRHGQYSGYASYGADALNIMVAAIREAGSTDGQQVRDAMEKLSFDGLTGSFQFSPSNHGGASGDGLTVLTVRSGGWVIAQ